MMEEIDLGIQKKMKSESAVPGVSAVEKLKPWKEQCSSKADLLNNSSLSYTLLLLYHYLGKNIILLLITAVADTFHLLGDVCAYFVFPTLSPSPEKLMYELD